MSYNQGQNLVFVGAAACVLDRNAMLAGTAATMQCFTNISTAYGVLLPGDLDGATPPPAGSHEYFLNFDANDESLDLWQFHVNWTTPSSSTFTGPTNIPVAAFTEPCDETIVELNYTTGACIPQSGTTQMLDSSRRPPECTVSPTGTLELTSLSSWPTTRWRPEQTATRRAFVAGTNCETLGKGFAQYQQETSDAGFQLSLRMGSIAMDKTGNIGLGYSVSSSTMSPSIRYTGRVPTDPLGQMESEVDVLSSARALPDIPLQTNSYRWGDYSSMAIDPTDDCTFWYYDPNIIRRLASPRWATRIASFQLPVLHESGQPPGLYSQAKTSKGGNPITNLTIPANWQRTFNCRSIINVQWEDVGHQAFLTTAQRGSNTYVSSRGQSYHQRVVHGNLVCSEFEAGGYGCNAYVLRVRRPRAFRSRFGRCQGFPPRRPDATNTSSGSA